MPGAPPPEPTSTIGPSKPETTSAPRSESSSSTRRASATSSIAVSPGVATSAASQRSRNGDDDDVPIRLGPLARRLDPVELLEAYVHHFAFHRRHRVELDSVAVREHTLRGAHRKRLERGAPPGPVARGIDDDLLALVRLPAVHRRVREVLDRVDRLTVPADQHPQVGPDARDGDRLVAFLDVDLRVDTVPVDDALYELPRFRREIALVVRRDDGRHRRNRIRRDGRDHAC